MKFTSHLLLAASVVCLLACTQENNNTSTETATANDLSSATTTTPQPAISTTIDSATGQPQITVDKNQPTSQPTAAGMNPPHGEPGHRCDIAVGAPLNSPAKTASPAGNSAPVINPAPASNNVTSPVLTAPTTAPVAAGTNPPHGQPGHDCAIPVGAPLKK